MPTREQLQRTAAEVIAYMKSIDELANSKISVIGGLALWVHAPQGRTTEDVDFIINIDSAPQSVKAKLLAIPESPFSETAFFFYYKNQENMKIQIDIVPEKQSPYLPTAAKKIKDLAEGEVPYISVQDLIIFKINCCGLRANKAKGQTDAFDARLLVSQLRSPLQLTPEQQRFVLEGIDDVVALTATQKTWWTEKLGLVRRDGSGERIPGEAIKFPAPERRSNRQQQDLLATMAQKTTLKEFEAVFPALEETILAHAKKYNLPEEFVAWFKQSLETNTLGGKCNRGMSVPDSVSVLLGRALTADEYRQAAMLGWMTELLQAFFLVSDDIMDSSITRRGKPCWYRQAGVGMVAINDAFMLESAIYTLLRTHFRAHPAYVDLLELFHETTLQTELGQLADLLTAPEDTVNLANFSMAKYSFIVIYKTAYYSFYLPVALALHMLGLGSEANLKTAEAILIPMGEYFQVQDDYLDNFGLPEHIGKIGTDIMDNKCSWLVNQALLLTADAPAQRAVLEQHYGRKDKASEAAVKALYDQLGLQQRYLDYEETRVAELRAQIAGIDESGGLKKAVFDEFLNKIYKRSK